jgi:hypothetical protein
MKNIVMKNIGIVTVHGRRRIRTENKEMSSRRHQFATVLFDRER